MPTNADVVSIQQEKVRPKLPEMFETSDFLLSEVQKNAEVEVVSTRDLRLPFVVSYGGDYGTYDPDGGDMGLGSGPQTTHYVTSYFPTKLGVQLTDLQMFATAKSEQAIKKAFALALAHTMQTFQAMEDASLHTPGNGVVATATAVAANTPTGKITYTLEATQFCQQLLRRQMKVHVYSNDLSTQKTTTGVRVEAMNPVDYKVILNPNSDVSSPAATDKLVFHGVSGATPSWKNSIPVFLSTATTGTLMSVDRAVYPEVICNWINAAGANLNGFHIMLILDAIEARRDNLGTLAAVLNPKQRTSWYKSGVAISDFPRQSGEGKPLDNVPKRVNEFTIAGTRAVVDKHQDRSRIDILDLKRWGRAVVKDVDWHQVGNQKTFPGRGATGGIAAYILMYVEMLSNFYTDDPGRQGFIYGLNTTITA